MAGHNFNGHNHSDKIYFGQFLTWNNFILDGPREQIFIGRNPGNYEDARLQLAYLSALRVIGPQSYEVHMIAEEVLVWVVAIWFTSSLSPGV